MTAEERLRAYFNRAPKNTVAVSPQVEAMLRRSSSADVQQQVRQIDTARDQEKTKKSEWYRGR